LEPFKLWIRHVNILLILVELAIIYLNNKSYFPQLASSIYMYQVSETINVIIFTQIIDLLTVYKICFINKLSSYFLWDSMIASSDTITSSLRKRFKG
jgi:hypothetical protein